MSGVVRTARADDAAGIATVHVQGWQAAYRGLVPDAILDGFDIAERTARWTALLDDRTEDDPSRVWVADDDGRVTGFAFTGRGRDESAPPPHGAGEVYAIYVAPERIGHGWGRALLARATEDLAVRSFDPLVVWVFEANPRARRFYEAAGFVVDGARHDIDFDGVLIPEVRYRLDGRPPEPPR